MKTEEKGKLVFYESAKLSVQQQIDLVLKQLSMWNSVGKIITIVLDPRGPGTGVQIWIKE